MDIKMTICNLEGCGRNLRSLPETPVDALFCTGGHFQGNTPTVKWVSMSECERCGLITSLCYVLEKCSISIYCGAGHRKEGWSFGTSEALAKAWEAII